MRTKPKILFVCKAESVHSARWISQLDREAVDLYIYPVSPFVQAHKGLEGYKVLIPLKGFFAILRKWKLGRFVPLLQFLLHRIRLAMNVSYESDRLAASIRKINPQLIHSLETQGAGYLVAGVKTRSFSNKSFPVWWHTNWGSDIFIYGRMEKHEGSIRSVLQQCDYYSCECERDVLLARSFGFNGEVLPVYPNTGGFDFEKIAPVLSRAQAPSTRKVIMLKGYQGWAGRALTGIRALERCADVLQGYRVIIYSNPHGEDVAIAAELFTRSTGVPVFIVPGEVSHMEILEMHSTARISIGLSIGDAISTSLLEAMAMGAFPVQSCTSCTSEWFTDGESGIVVPPEDPHIIEAAIRKALSNDAMVDRAAEINLHTIRSRAEYQMLKEKTIRSYHQILSRIK